MMKGKRTLMALGLGVALLGGGAATSVHASTHASTHATTRTAAVTADVVAGDTSAQTADTDPAAPCVTDAATGDQTGNCQDSQNTGGPADTAGASGEVAAAGPDTDTVQQGDQSGAD